MSEHNVPRWAELVRRLDWRFLLPVEAPVGTLVLLGATDRLADAAVRVGFARRVSTTLRDVDDAAVVAVLSVADPVPKVDDVLDVLSPDGVVYWETDRRRRGCRTRSPARLRSAFERSGAAVRASFAIRPALDRCEAYLPLNHPAAVPWYLASVYPATTGPQRLAQGALSVLIRGDGRRLGPLVPFHALVAVAKPGTASTATLVDRVNAQRGSGREQLTPALLTDSGNRATFLTFEPGRSSPTLVLKVPKLPSFVSRTISEQRMSASVREAAGPLASTIPEPLGTCPVGGGIVIGVERAVTGVSMARTSGLWGRRMRAKVGDLRLAAGWIERLHRDAPVRVETFDASLRRKWIDEPMDGFAARFGATEDESLLFADVRAAASQIEGTKVPCVWEHRDFTHSNVLRDGHTLHVIDWEGVTDGAPLSDLLRFVVHWHDLVTGRRRGAMDGDAFGQLVAALVSPRSQRAGCMACRAARAAVDRYMAALSLPSDLVPVMLVASWAELAVRRADQRRDGGDPDADLRAGNVAVTLLGLLLSNKALRLALRRKEAPS